MPCRAPLEVGEHRVPTAASPGRSCPHFTGHPSPGARGRHERSNWSTGAREVIKTHPVAESPPR
jgi:hypothetical protein